MKTFEMVLLGHPDKACDYIAERVAKKLRKKYGATHTSVEVAWFGDKIIVGGEYNGREFVDYDKDNLAIYVGEIVDADLLVEAEILTVDILINRQSPEIAALVGNDTGAGDNGLFVAGYDLMWSPIVSKLKAVAKALSPHLLKQFGYKSDGKFIAEFDDNGVLQKFTLNVASWENRDICGLRNKLNLFFKEHFGVVNVDLEINPKGDWSNCWGFADAGLSGRKLACDYQGGLFPIGGGAIFGKDNSKADRSVNAWLYLQAKDECEKFKWGNYTVETSCIIGDKEIVIDNGHDIRKKPFADIVREMNENYEIDIFGEITPKEKGEY